MRANRVLSADPVMILLFGLAPKQREESICERLIDGMLHDAQF